MQTVNNVEFLKPIYECNEKQPHIFNEVLVSTRTESTVQSNSFKQIDMELDNQMMQNVTNSSSRIQKEFTSDQSKVLFDYFNRSKNISTRNYQKIAKELNVDEHRIRLWFRNRRKMIKQDPRYRFINFHECNERNANILRQRRRRITERQKIWLEDIFKRYGCVYRNERVKIAEQLNLSEKTVHNWLNNFGKREVEKTIIKEEIVKHTIESLFSTNQQMSVVNTFTG